MATDVWSKIELRQGDITKLRVDAIVNAANSHLANGAGVNGAIHRAAGATELLAACRPLGGCDTGDAKITPGFALPAKHIIHTVGPVYYDGSRGEPQLLASCYRRSLEVAMDHGLRTIAFPAVSTGVFGYPFRSATEIALRTVQSFLSGAPSIERVILIFYSAEDFAEAQAILAEVQGAPP